MSELTEQIELVKFLEILKAEGRIILFSSIPSGQWQPSFNQQRINQASGLRRGVPDLMIVTQNSLIFIEMKDVKNGKLSTFQREWITELNKIQNVKAFVCNGCEEARNMLESLL